MASPPLIVVGAGIGGLTAAALAAARGHAVTVLERAAAPGGKMRALPVGQSRIDGGPTVLTMRSVFDAVFDACGAKLDDAVRLEPLSVLARHAWPDGGRLDLFADVAASADAIAAFAGPREAAGFRAFQRDAARMFATLDGPFLHGSRPDPISLTLRVGLHRLADMLAIRPFTPMWAALGSYFRDPRLRQLFGRYATYCGASPFAAPTTLMLIAHVEQAGVWRVAGGMHGLAAALAQLVTRAGGRIRYGAEVSRIRVQGGRAVGVTCASGEALDADAVIFNGDAAALRAGLLGDPVRSAGPSPRARSLSALTWAMEAQVDGFPLAHHTVFFSDDYAREFETILRARRLPETPTVYICAQDRADGGEGADRPTGQERLLALVNAPADGAAIHAEEIARCTTRTWAHLAQMGLTLTPHAATTTGPAEFATLFPGSQGALYGAATHGWAAAFQRPGARTAIEGLYLAGGTVHPGPGVPMAALSGRQALLSLEKDRASMRRSSRAVIAGGTSTPSATMGAAP